MWASRVTVHGPGLAHLSSRNRTLPTIHGCLLRQRIRKNVPVSLLQVVNGYASRLLWFAVAIIVAANAIAADDNLDESKAIAKIELLGGKVTKDDTLPGSPVFGIDLTGSKKFNDKYLHLLNSFKSLSSLILVDCKQITDAGIDELRNHKHLALLDIRGTQITLGGVDLLWESLPKLQSREESQAIQSIKVLGGQVVRDMNRSSCHVTKLFLARSRISDEGLQELVNLPGVTVLALDYTEITDLGLKPIVELKNLTSLSLRQTKITDIGLKELVGLEHLTSLNLMQCDVSDVGMKEIKALKRLTVLEVSGQKLTDRSLKELSELKDLRRLVFVNAPITDEGLKDLIKLTRLTELNLNRTRISDAGLKEISRLNLQELNLGETQITDVGLKELGGLTGLKRIYLGGTRTTHAGVKESLKLVPRVDIRY